VNLAAKVLRLGFHGNDSTSFPATGQTLVMGITVWVDNWQMQCCGEPFALGSHVAWTLGPADPDWLDAVLGAHEQQTVDAAEEHHGGVAEDTLATTGMVTRIRAVHCRFAPRPGSDSRTLYPVRASGVLTDVESADGWTADRGDERFAGYLVQLEL
jgi:hypothetical protein